MIAKTITDINDLRYMILRLENQILKNEACLMELMKPEVETVKETAPTIVSSEFVRHVIGRYKPTDKFVTGDVMHVIAKTCGPMSHGQKQCVYSTIYKMVRDGKIIKHGDGALSVNV